MIYVVLEMHQNSPVSCPPTQEFDLGKHQVRQQIEGEVVNEYQFPTGFRLSTRALVTLWASGDPMTNRFDFPPKDIQCQTVAHWIYGSSCTTMLCDPSGQVQNQELFYFSPRSISKNSWQ